MHAYAAFVHEEEEVGRVIGTRAAKPELPRTTVTFARKYFFLLNSEHKLRLLELFCFLLWNFDCAARCVTIHCSALQHTATHCNALQHTTIHCSALQHTATHFIVWQDVSRYAATHCNTLQHTATHCNTLQHTTIYCSALQHTATHFIVWQDVS